jgi:hypothetical protein
LIAFPDETKGNRSYRTTQDWNKSEKLLFDFLRLYEICPNLINMPIAKQFFAECRGVKPVFEDTALAIFRQHVSKIRLMKDPDRIIGKNFTFACFLDFLVKCSVHVFRGASGAESVATMLERIDMTKVFEKKSERTFHSAMSLQPSKSIIEKMKDPIYNSPIPVLNTDPS